MTANRLPRGHADEKKALHDNLRLFSRRARTWIVSVSGILIGCFVILPMTLNRLDRANTTIVTVMSVDHEVPTPTPIPSALIDNMVGQNESAATPEPSSEVHVSQFTLLQQGDDYPAVQNLQLRLMELGYLDADEPTTHYGSATAMAVSLFQRTLEYDMNGVADSALQERLFSEGAEPYEMKLGDDGADVKRMQSRLAELGYFDDKISGFFGVATEDAVKAFQKKNKLDVDGVFHLDDCDLLFSPDARPFIDPTPTPKPTAKPTPKPTKKPSSGGSSSGSGSSGSTDPTEPPESPSGGDGDSDEPSSGSHSPDGIVAAAKSKLGKPYRRGEEGPNAFDCSGLVYYCLKTCGVKASRYNAISFSRVDSWTKISDMDDLQKGDLLFFKSDSSSSVNHTGIYIGGGKFIHASSSAGKVITSNISTSYWVRNFVNGRRVF